jgi:xylulokinase
MMLCLIGIDIGSSNLKAAVFELNGKIVAKHSVTNPLNYFCEEWTEYNPEKIWEGVVFCLQSCMNTLGQDVKAVSISSMGEVGIPLDKNNFPLYPAISWFDKRTVPQADWWVNNFGKEKVLSITGMPLDPMYSINKIMWLRDNIPDVYKSMKKWVCLPDYILFKLTGELSTDYTIASRTMAFDIRKKDWSEELCEAVGIDIALFPSVAPSGTVVGIVTASASEVTSLPKGTPVVLGGHDHACVALALGLFSSDEIIDSTGTGEAIAFISDSPKLPDSIAATNRYACYPHCLPGKYLVLGHLGVVGGILKWVLNITGGKIVEPELNSKLIIYFPHFIFEQEHGSRIRSMDGNESDMHKG